jgi:hypothetical protein
MIGVGTVFAYIGLFVGVGTLIGGVVNLVLGHFRQAFFQVVFGAGFSAVIGYQQWYGRNIIGKRKNGAGD